MSSTITVAVSVLIYLWCLYLHVTNTKIVPHYSLFDSSMFVQCTSTKRWFLVQNPRFSSFQVPHERMEKTSLEILRWSFGFCCSTWTGSFAMLEESVKDVIRNCTENDPYHQVTDFTNSWNLQCKQKNIIIKKRKLLKLLHYKFVCSKR